MAYAIIYLPEAIIIEAGIRKDYYQDINVLKNCLQCLYVDKHVKSLDIFFSSCDRTNELYKKVPPHLLEIIEVSDV